MRREIAHAASGELRADRGDRARGPSSIAAPGGSRRRDVDRSSSLEQFVERQDPAEDLDRPRHLVGAALRRFEAISSPASICARARSSSALGQRSRPRPARTLRARFIDSAARCAVGGAARPRTCRCRR